MLKLNNVSKYYHSNDVVALGLRKVNLEFKLGEFIAVTGESGSGKSTLLNVISGLDTYEDGEMYVNGEETSYFSIEDWESYRRQYIGFVFQNYNIIDSYSVLENVMVALTIQGYPKEEIKQRAIQLIDKVGLSSHVHHKASKLSGGQKQRAVIARALAKDCPIIVCDEPTGNLDSESSRVIMELLEEISNDKLVIVVTHNYDEVEEFATRRIRLFDGEVVEDKQVGKKRDTKESIKLANYRMSPINLAGIALRNLFRTPRRTIFTMIVAIFIAVIFTFSYGSYTQQASGGLSFGGFGYFENVTVRRIILTKYDKTSFTDTEIDTILNTNRVRDVLEHDVTMDTNLYTYAVEYDWVYGQRNLINPAKMLDAGDLQDGRLPESKYEVVVQEIEGYSVGDDIEVGYEYPNVEDIDDIENSITFTIVGITKNIEPNSWYQRMYFHEDFVKSDEVVQFAYLHGRYEESYLEFSMYENYGTTNEKEYKRYYNNFVINDDLNDGEIRLHSSILQEMAWELGEVEYEGNEDFYEGVTYTLESSSAFYTKSVEFEVVGEYINDEKWGVIEINSNTMEQLISTEPYQISVLVKDTYDAEKVMDELEDAGFNIIYPTNMGNQFEEVLQLISNIGFGFQVVVLMVIIYFISYIVLRNVQNAKKKDYLIFRSIGASKKDLNKVTILELFFTVVMAYIITMVLLVINEQFNTFIPQYLRYFTVWSYIYIFLLLAILSLFLGQRFNKKIFSNSVITSLKQE